MSTADSKVPDNAESFPDLNADSDLERLTVMQSMCMNCHENGETRMLLCKIPYFGSVIVCSFRCELCGFADSETRDASDLKEKGVHYELTVNADEPNVKEVLDRQVIRGEKATIRIPEVDFEIPARKGEITTVEGIVRMCADALDATYLQSDNDMDEKALLRIDELVDWFREAGEGKHSFTLILDDLTGNSFIQNPKAPQKDDHCVLTRITRTRKQTQDLGYAVPDDETKTLGGPAKLVSLDMKSLESKMDTFFDVESKVAVLTGTCQNCNQENETRMCLVDIPKFKEIIIMATRCIHCGFKDCEVKPSGAIADLGSRTSLRVQSEADLKREVLKSDSASIEIPEIDLKLMSGTLGGKYTTVEGLLDDIEQELKKINMFHLGDSATSEQKENMTSFLAKFVQCKTCKIPFTLIIEDPLGNCYIGCVDAEFNLNGREVNDPQLTIEEFERTDEQNEDLGIADMKTENYETPEQLAQLSREEADERLLEAGPANDDEDDEEDDEDSDDDEMPDLMDIPEEN